MEPLTATAIATLLLTKMLEKLGEKVGEKLPELTDKAWEQISKLRGLLREKSPETATTLEQVVDRPELEQQKPEQYSVDVLVEKVDAVAQADPEVSEAIQTLAAEVQPRLPESVVKQAIGIGLKVKGNLELAKAKQEAQAGASSTEQRMLEDVDVQGDINLGDLEQTVK